MIDHLVTCVIPTSPIPSHPSTEIIEETIESIRWHLPEAKISVMADGVRVEQEDKRADYEKYVSYLEEICSDPEENITMVAFNEHVHQVGLMREFMKEVSTPYVLFCEHDTPICPKPIDWNAIHIELNAGVVDFVRFLPEPQIHQEHLHLMLDEIRTAHILLRKTIQFSARPHIATVDFYRRLLERFTPEAKSFIEDYSHSFCQTEPWSNWKMSVYLDPEGINSQRSYHLDGRAGHEKFDGLQVF